MKTPQELDKIYNRLPKEKTELSVEKVELGIGDDLGKLMSKLEKSAAADKKFEKEISEYNKKQKSLVKEIEKTEISRDKLEDKGQKMISENNDIFNKVDNLLEKAKRAAKELGVKPQSITNFKKAESLISNLVIANSTRDLDKNTYF